MIVLLIRVIFLLVLSYRLHLGHTEADPAKVFAQLLNDDRSVVPVTERGQNGEEVDERSLQHRHQQTQRSRAGEQRQHPVDGLTPRARHLRHNQATLTCERNLISNY